MNYISFVSRSFNTSLLEIDRNTIKSFASTQSKGIQSASVNAAQNEHQTLTDETNMAERHRHIRFIVKEFVSQACEKTVKCILGGRVRKNKEPSHQPCNKVRLSIRV